MRCKNFLLSTAKKNAMDRPYIRVPVSALKIVMRSILQKLAPTEKTHVGLSRSRLNT
jgi:hypothetical protein